MYVSLEKAKGMSRGAKGQLAILWFLGNRAVSLRSGPIQEEKGDWQQSA